MASAYSSELIYLMNYYGLKSVPIFHGSNCCGRVVLGKDNALSYDTKRSHKHFGDAEDAFKLARVSVDNVIGIYKDFLSDKEVSVNVRYEYKPYNREGEIREETWSGTLLSIMERFYKANHRLSYCHDSNWVFANVADRVYYSYYFEFLDSGLTKDSFLDVYMRNGGDMW